MARRRRRASFHDSYEKRPVPGEYRPGEEPASGMNGSEARALGALIDVAETRWRTNGVRLVARGTCCVVVRDRATNRELEVHSRADWAELVTAETSDGV